jgi:hypothetical protein
MTMEGFDGPDRNALHAQAVHEPWLRHGIVSSCFGMTNIGGDMGQPPIEASADLVLKRAKKAASGDLSNQMEMLAIQADTLDAVFTSFATRASLNANQFPAAAETYLRLALKAQANSRATIEALAKLTRGGEQVIKHVHVDNRGGQAVFTESVQTGGRNGNGGEQPCEPGLAAACSPALSRPNPLRDGMPVSGDAERPMQDTWREVAGGAEGKPKRMAPRRAVG